jgi:hypothetical protein
MRIADYTLRKLIRETLLNEEVFGKMAFVYHGSNSPPAEMVKLLKASKKLDQSPEGISGDEQSSEEDPEEEEFMPGSGAGAAYGKGLYAVYDLEGTQTADGSYGQYIYKLAVNFDGFISFDPEATLKTYGAALTPAEQAKMLGLGWKFVKKLEQIHPKRPEKFTSDEANAASKFLAGAAKGIIFTGRNDGKVAVIYDASVVTPTSYKRAGDGSWTRIEKATLDSFRGRTSSRWNPEKYQVSQLKEIERVESFLNRFKNKRGPSPAGVIFDGNMDLKAQFLTELPVDGLRVKGNFYVSPTMTSLPADLRVDGHLDMFESLIESMPRGLSVGKSLKISSQAKNVDWPFSVGEDLYAEGSAIDQIPPGTTVGGNAELEASRVKKLPDNFTVGGNLILKWTPILELPRGLKVGGTLDLRKTNVYSLPSDLEVGDRIYMDELDRSTIPAHMKGATDKKGMRKIWAAS